MRSTLAATVALMVIAASLQAAPPFDFPDTRMGRIAATFFEIYNSGDAERMKAFTLENRSEASLKKQTIERRTEQFVQMRNMIGELDVHGLLGTTEQSIAFHAHSAKLDSWLQVEFTFEANEPFKLDQMSMRPASPPELATISYDDWNTLDELAERVRADLKVPGLAIAIADASEILGEAAAGVRSIEAGEAVGIDDAFHIGSVTKSMTATVIGALVEQGRIQWNTTIAEALPGVEMHDGYRDVTITQLLQHRGGIVQHQTLNDEQMSHLVALPGTPTEQRAAYAAEVLLEGPIGPAGGDSRYSNAGYTVAGHIAERVSGASWETLMHEHVFKAASMSTAGIGWPATSDRPDAPRGHFGDSEGVRSQRLDEYPLGAFMSPAGHVHCSAGDLARYGQMHLRGLLGNECAWRTDVVRILHTPGGTDGGMPYACGWAILEESTGEVHWHNGSAGTFYASIAIDPKGELVITTVVNQMVGACDDLAERMRAAIIRRYDARNNAASPNP